MKKSLLFAGIIMIIAMPLFAADYGGVTAAPYLNLGIGARPCGMGEAYTAVVDNVDAGFWNPGALVKVVNPQFAFMHNIGFGGTSYEYLGYAVPAEQLGIDIWGSIGITAILVRVDDVDITKEEGVNGVWGDYSVDQDNKNEVYGAGGTLIGVSYAWQAAKMVSVGATLKLINQKVALEEGWIPGLDLGVLAKTFFPGFDIGLTFQNISYTNLNGAPLPLNLKFGVGYKAPRLFTPEATPKDKLVLAVDGILPIIPSNMPFRLQTGLEYSYDIADNVVKARVGYRFNGNKFISDLGPLAGLTAGLGYSRVFDGVDVGLDYAFIPYGELGMSHRISMTISIGEPTPTPTPSAVNPPKAVKLRVDKKKIMVSWSIENKDKYQGYNVYMSYKPGGKYYKLTKTPLNKHYLSVGPLKSGLRVYFVVASVGKDGKESKYSKELSAVPK